MQHRSHRVIQYLPRKVCGIINICLSTPACESSSSSKKIAVFSTNLRCIQKIPQLRDHRSLRPFVSNLLTADCSDPLHEQITVKFQQLYFYFSVKHRYLLHYQERSTLIKSKATFSLYIKRVL